MDRLDLRLALPAATAWGSSAIACGVAGGGPALTAGGAVGLLVACLLRRFALAAAAVGVLLSASSAMVHVAATHSGPVASLARAHGHAVATLTLVRDPQPRVSAHGFRYLLVDATVDAVGGRGDRAAVLLIAHGSRWDDLLPGQRLRAPVRLSPAHGGDGLVAVALAVGDPTLVGRPPWWQRAAGAVRERLRRSCGGLPADEQGLVPGLVVGDVRAMPPSLTAAFRASGLTHLNAVSGENCAIVLAAVGAVVRRTPLSRTGRIAAAAVALLGFVVLARPSPSVLRAAVMGGAALAAGALGRRTQPLPLLSGAVLVLLLCDPFLALAPGFALSVLATAAIVLLARPLTDRLARAMPRPVAAAIAVPAAAQLACTPVLVALFGQLTPWAVPANLLAAPAVAPATLLGVAAAVVAVVAPPVAASLAWCAAVPAAWLAVVARTFATLPGSRSTRDAVVVTVLLAAVALAALARRARVSSLRAMLGAWPP